MSTDDNVRIVEEFFAAAGRGDEPGLQAITAEDVEWIIPGDWAWAGAHRGQEGLMDFLRKAPGTVEIRSSGPREFVAQGERVIVLGTAAGIVKATERTFEDHYVFDFTIRAGKVSKIREYIDTLALARASGTAADPPS